MSLDLSLYRGKEEVAELNWLRNPFGLCQWAEDNAGVKDATEESTLWFVCNHWAYDKGGDVDRPHFLKVVRAYEQRVAALDKGYFFFDLSGFRQFVLPHYNAFPLKGIAVMEIPIIVGEKYVGERLAIPQELFAPKCFNIDDPSLEEYKRWFGRLVAFAEALQDTALEFYCSN